MTSWANYALSGFTLHSLLSYMELFALLSVIYTVARRWKRHGKVPWSAGWLSMSTNFKAMIGRFEIPALRSALVKLRSRLSTIRIRTKGKGLARLYTMFWIVFTVGIVVAVSYGFAHPRDFPIEKHHNVYVWSQVQGTTDTWWVSGNGLPFSRWKCCPDFPCATVVWPGYIAATVKYEERGSCKSIRADGLGWFWETDDQGNVKEW